MDNNKTALSSAGKPHRGKIDLLSLIATVLSILLALLWFAPLVWLVGTALTETSFNMTFLPTTPFTWEHIKYVWNAVPFAQYYLNTLTICVLTFGIQVVTSTLAAYALAFYNVKGIKLVFVVIFMQIIIPNDVLIIPNFMTLSKMGLIDTKLAIMFPFLGSALAIFLLRQTFKTVPRALGEAARLDGANLWQIIWRVYVPCAKPAYLSFAVISVSYHWNNYLWPLVVTQSVTNRPLTVGLAIFAKSKEADMQWSNVCAATLIIVAPLLITFFIMQKQFMDSFVGAGIKE